MTQLEEIKADGAGNVSGELRQCTAKVNDLPFTGGETMRGVLIAGVMSWYLYRAIAATGALDRFASGRARRDDADRRG